jgi:polyisoprenoid-binding protein YceI
MFKLSSLVALFGVVLLLGAGALLLLRPPAPASAPIQAVPLEASQADPAFEPEVTAASQTRLTTYTIQPGASHARFRVDEVLRGEPRTVVGETDQVAGQLALDLAQPSTVQVGPIRINARTLATDSAQRDRAIRSFILSTDEHEYLTFTPNALQGLPPTAVPGGSYTLQIVGQLAIRDVSREVTFDATVRPVSSTELAGTARTTIRYADWGISVPDVPFVAGVSDDAEIELEFVAITAP